MFDWQAELAPPAAPPIATSSHIPAVAIISAVEHAALSAPLSTHARAAIPKPSFVQALRGTHVQTEPLPMPFIRGETLSITISTLLTPEG